MSEKIESSTSPPTSKFITYNDIATKLLDDKLLLSALELHFELLELGKELPKLRDFFSNPGNFEQSSATSRLEYLSSIPRSSSQATLDSLDFTRYSEDGERGVDERVAVLEFELRKAKETISSLRTNLTDATLDKDDVDNECSKSTGTICDIKPYEKRCLNFLINEYLLFHSYKLTSITFADENEDQDFEDWDDVGLNMPKPPELLQLYRERVKNSGVPNYDSSSQTEQHNKEEEEIYLMTKKIAALELERDELKIQVENIQNTINTTSTTQQIYMESNNILTDALEDLDRDSNHFDITEDHIDDHTDSALDRDSVQLDRDSTHFADKDGDSNLSVHDTDKFEIIEGGGGNLSQKTNDSNDRISLDAAGDDTSSINENDWTKLSYTNTNDKGVSHDIVNAAICERNFPEAFHKEILSRCFVSASHTQVLLVELEESGISEEVFLHIVTKTVIENSKNDDFFPLLIASILLTTDPNQRDTLIQILFNTKKRPTEEERKRIIAGISTILRNFKDDILIIENEILSQLWELVTNKYLEKRLLISELCCSLAPYVTVGSRSCYLLPVLQQLLLEDKEDVVRRNVVKSLTLIISLIYDIDKYLQCEELVITGLQDVSRDVIDMTSQTLLPVVAKWSLDIRRLESHFIIKLLQLVSSQIKKTLENDKNSTNSSISNSKWEHRACLSVQALCNTLPYLVIFVASSNIVIENYNENVTKLPPAQSRPNFSNLCKGLCNPIVFYQNENHNVAGLISSFDHLLTQNIEWEELSWLKNIFLHQLISMAESIPLSHQSLVSYFINLFRSFCAGFGHYLTLNMVKPLFQEKIDILEKCLVDFKNEDWTSMVILPIYVLSVLTSLTDGHVEILSTLKQFIFSIALCGAPTEALSYTVRELSRISTYQETVVRALWEGVVHARPIVRSVTALLFMETIPHMNDSIITTKVVPGLVTLSSDPDISVKSSTVPVFGALLTNPTKKEIQDKTYFQFQTFLGDETLLENHSSQLHLISTLGKIAPSSLPWFRDEVVVPQLCTWACSLSQLQSATRKQDILLALLDAYSHVLYTSLTPNTIVIYMLPGLRQLEVPCTDLVPGQLETLRGMIKEAESRTGQHKTPQTPVLSKTSSSVQKINKILSPLQTSNLFNRRKN